MTIYTDDFDRASLGANWSNVNATWGSLQIVSNAASASASNSNNEALAYWNANAVGADQEAEVTISGLSFLSGDFVIGAACRISADTDADRDAYFVYVAADSGGPNYTTVLGKVVNGTRTVLHSAAVPWVDTDAIRLRVVGTTLTVMKNGVALGGSFTQTDTALASGQPGAVSNGSAPVALDWAGGDVVSFAEDQEGAQFYNDDGSESGATAAAAQDANLTAPLNVNKILRAIIDATGDPASGTYTIRYQKNGSGGYVDVPVGSSSTVTTSPAQPSSGTPTTIGTAAGTWALNRATASTGDMVVFAVAWDDSVTVASITAPSGPNGESAVSIAGPVASASTEMRVQAWYYIATGTWSAGTLTFAPAASETCRAVSFAIPAAQFNASDPIGFANTRASAGTAESTVNSPTGTAEADDGDGRLFIAYGSDVDAITAPASGTTTIDNATGGGVGLCVVSRNTLVSNSESITAIAATITSDSWAALCFVVKPKIVVTTNEFFISPSANIAAAGVATTARLTPPSGKTTGDFQAALLLDDANAQTWNPAADVYGELGWCLQGQSPMVNGDFVDLRVYKDGSALDSYTNALRLTFASGGIVEAIGTSSTTDSALAVTSAKARAISTATTTATALPIGAAKSLAIGAATATDTAQPFSSAKAATLGIATATDSALPITHLGPQDVEIQTATVTDGALPLLPAKSKAIATAMASESAQLVAVSKARAIGTAGVTDAALALGGAKSKAIAEATVTDAALPITRFVPVTRAVSILEFTFPRPGSGPLSAGKFFIPRILVAPPTPAGGPHEVAISTATVTDTARAFASAKARAIGIATTTAAALAIARGKSRTVGVATATESAQPIAAAKAKAVGTAAVTDTALPLSQPGEQNIAVGTATSTDTALPILRGKAKAIGTATTTSAALTLARLKARAIAAVQSIDTALPITRFAVGSGRIHIRASDRPGTGIARSDRPATVITISEASQ